MPVLFFTSVVAARAAVKDYPVRVRMVLVKVTPLLEKQNYEEAAKILTVFREKANGPEDRIHDHAEINFVLGKLSCVHG